MASLADDRGKATDWHSHPPCTTTGGGRPRRLASPRLRLRFSTWEKEEPANDGEEERGGVPLQFPSLSLPPTLARRQPKLGVEGARGTLARLLLPCLALASALATERSATSRSVWPGRGAVAAAAVRRETQQQQHSGPAPRSRTPGAPVALASVSSPPRTTSCMCACSPFLSLPRPPHSPRHTPPIHAEARQGERGTDRRTTHTHTHTGEVQQQHSEQRGAHLTHAC